MAAGLIGAGASAMRMRPFAPDPCWTASHDRRRAVLRWMRCWIATLYRQMDDEGRQISNVVANKYNCAAWMRPMAPDVASLFVLCVSVRPVSAQTRVSDDDALVNARGGRIGAGSKPVRRGDV